jgi:hypothetical protein
MTNAEKIAARPIDLIDGKGNITEHLTRDDRSTTCGLVAVRSQPAAGGNRVCKRCVRIVSMVIEAEGKSS